MDAITRRNTNNVSIIGGVSDDHATTLRVTGYHPVYPPDDRLWFPWLFRFVEALAVVYALFLMILWILDGSNTATKLHLGYWFGWQVPMLALLLPPYIIAFRGTFEGVDYSNNHRGAILEQHATWIHVRAFVHFILALGALAVDVIFFVVMIEEFVDNCDAGTECSDETTTYAVATVVALLQAIIALVLVIAIARCSLLPASVIMPAPPPYKKKKPLHEAGEMKL